MRKRSSSPPHNYLIDSPHACSLMPDSLWPCGLQPSRLLCPWDFQARMLEWVAPPSPAALSDPGIEPASPVWQILYHLSRPGSRVSQVALVVKEPACQCKRHRRGGSHPWVWTIPRRRKWQPTPVCLPEKSHGQRSLPGYTVHEVAKSWTWLKPLSKQTQNAESSLKDVDPESQFHG